MQAQLEWLWTIWYKKATIRYKNPTFTSEVLGAKAGCDAWYVHIAPLKGWADHLSHPCGPTHHLPLPSFHLRNQLTPLQGVNKGNCYLFLLSHHVAQFPVKPCLNSSSGLLSISIDQRVQGPESVTLSETQRGQKDLSLIHFRGSMALPPPWFWTSSLQSC